MFHKVIDFMWDLLLISWCEFLRTMLVKETVKMRKQARVLLVRVLIPYYLSYKIELI